MNKRLKYILTVVLCILLPAGAVPGCANKTLFYTDIVKLYEEISLVADLTQMYELDADTVQVDYGVKPGDVSQIYVVNSSLDVNASEVFLCEASSEEARDSIVTKLENRRSRKMNEMKNYENNPGRQQQWLNLERSEVMSEDMFVFYVVLDDDKVVTDLIRAAIKQAKGG